MSTYLDRLALFDIVRQNIPKSWDETLNPYEDNNLEAYEVSKEVNNVRNNSPDLVKI